MQAKLRAQTNRPNLKSIWRLLFPALRLALGRDTGPATVQELRQQCWSPLNIEIGLRELSVVLVYISNSFDRVLLHRTAVGVYFQLMNLTAYRVG